MEGFDGASVAAFPWALSVSDGPPSSVIGSPPTLRRSVGALLLRIVVQYLQREYMYIHMFDEEMYTFIYTYYLAI